MTDIDELKADLELFAKAVSMPSIRSDVGHVIDGRFRLDQLVAVMDDDGRWRCPHCHVETNSYGHHTCSASEKD